jgi:hypothetical protein
MGEAARRLERGDAIDLTVVASAAAIVRRFVEDYHEKTEEDFVFPRLEVAGREARSRRRHRPDSGLAR